MNGENSIMKINTLSDSEFKSKTAVISFTPIGFFKTKQIEPYHAARQPDEMSEPGEIIMLEKNNFEQAMQNLNDCSHIWIIYHFHHNQNWKPLVQTPRSKEKIGVFATRAPYRPNPIGMSVVKLINIKGLKIQVGPNDLLDGTPILDIKPYHFESDLIHDSQIAWLDQALTAQFNIRFSPLVENQIDFLEINNLKEIKTFILRQLEYNPTDKNRKRVQKNDQTYELSYRTWRIDFIILDLDISVLSIRSGYTSDDLTSIKDLYFDKELHKKFIKEFN